jgi:hypothetical protein
MSAYEWRGGRNGNGRHGEEILWAAGHEIAQRETPSRGQQEYHTVTQTKDDKPVRDNILRGAWVQGPAAATL